MNGTVYMFLSFHSNIINSRFSFVNDFDERTSFLGHMVYVRWNVNESERTLSEHFVDNSDWALNEKLAKK